MFFYFTSHILFHFKMELFMFWLDVQIQNVKQHIFIICNPPIISDFSNPIFTHKNMHNLFSVSAPTCVKNDDYGGQCDSFYYFHASFTPRDHDVIIGRGRASNNHIGNKRLGRIVASKLDVYSIARTKNDKTDLISSIIDQIRTNSPKGAFVKQDLQTKLWYDAGNFAAREKISRMFRDALHEAYKSSNSNKKKQRHIKKIEATRRNMCAQSKMIHTMEEEHHILYWREDDFWLSLSKFDTISSGGCF